MVNLCLTASLLPGLCSRNSGFLTPPTLRETLSSIHTFKYLTQWDVFSTYRYVDVWSSSTLFALEKHRFDFLGVYDYLLRLLVVAAMVMSLQYHRRTPLGCFFSKGCPILIYLRITVQARILHLVVAQYSYSVGQHCWKGMIHFIISDFPSDPGVGLGFIVAVGLCLVDCFYLATVTFT